MCYLILCLAERLYCTPVPRHALDLQLYKADEVMVAGEIGLLLLFGSLSYNCHFLSTVMFGLLYFSVTG